MYQMKMLSQLRTDRLTDQLLELLEWLFATKKVAGFETRHGAADLLLLERLRVLLCRRTPHNYVVVQFSKLQLAANFLVERDNET